ncbi:hypothetical protein [Micromonospora sp. NPDC051296]|uniref:NACHT domain-containing protein n=1 Tax=Micromonospora sp. NPDC051296 TaxID=3155046 RepID=UPI00343B3F5F
MPDTLGYADAVRLLGGEKSPFVERLDTLTGGALLGASVPVPALLGLLDARADLIRLGHELVRTVSERRTGLSRYGRTQRLEAAHAVLAVTAFFETLGELGLPFDFAAARITRAEQLSLAGARFAADDVTAALFATAAPVPGPHLPYSALRIELFRYYDGLSLFLGDFLRGLAVVEALSEARWVETRTALKALPPVAVDRHRELLTRLAVDFPEVSFWLGLHEHQATREELRQLALGLDELQRALTALSTGGLPDGRRAGLAAAYAAELRRPILTSGDIPAGLTVPTLGAAYVPPLCRIAELHPGVRPSDEQWWRDQPVRDDLWQSLVVHLTSSGATRAPLLVLGQPGSGKSVFTRIVAARLPAADFLVVRVVLREVDADADLQDQMEQAIRKDTGERIDWPALARSAGDALPVVLLDGFDELLQATGVSQTDYLRRVAAFQTREADQGRPVAVLVTSRTSVADRAQPPTGTVAIRLEPFDDARVAAWVDTWNRVNAAAFRAVGTCPLDRATVLSHRELAEQPLLLLMLALYDAEGGELRQAGDLRRGELYERLLSRFARREVAKHRVGLPERMLDQAVEEELRRLAVVAFAMFNRGAQWVTSAELDADLTALRFIGTPDGERVGLRPSLAPAELLLGRFFFIHRARASAVDAHRETYEFLHATFGEYLVARFTGQVVDELVHRYDSTGLGWGGERVDDDLLHALLSYAVLSTRTTVLAFLTERLAGRDEAYRAAWAELLLRLFQAAPHATGTRHFDGYRPRRLRVPARYAAYGANLLLLILVAAGEVTGRGLFPEAADPADAWRAEVGLWRSQLDPDEWSDLNDLLALERLGRGADRDVRIWSDERFALPPDLDLGWTLGAATRPGHGYRVAPEEVARLLRTAHLSCDAAVALAVHAVEPVYAQLQTALATFPELGGSATSSVGHALIEAWLLPLRPATEQHRLEVYLRCVKLVVAAAGLVEDWDRAAYLRLLLDRLAQDHEASATVVTTVLVAAGDLLAHPEVRVASLRCADRVMDVDANRWLRVQIGTALPMPIDVAFAETLLYLHEWGNGLAVPQSVLAVFEERYGRQRPDLVRRLRLLTEGQRPPSAPGRPDGGAAEPEADV